MENEIITNEPQSTPKHTPTVKMALNFREGASVEYHEPDHIADRLIDLASSENCSEATRNKIIDTVRHEQECKHQDRKILTIVGGAVFTLLFVYGMHCKFNKAA